MRQDNEDVLEGRCPRAQRWYDASEPVEPAPDTAMPQKMKGRLSLAFFEGEDAWHFARSKKPFPLYLR
jgi:hypothetical protein